MSHFFTVVLVPVGADVESIVDKRLAPYDESIEVDEYDRNCGCIGSVAHRDARVSATKKVGKSIAELRDEYWKIPENERPEWKDWNAEYVHAEDEEFTKHPMKSKHDPECFMCRGTGTYRSTRNPESKWDWFEIGGRWDGEIPGNRVLASKLSNDLLPHAVVTPDGKWHEQGEMGWWGMSFGDKPEEEWREKVRRLFLEFKESLAVAVDCHI